MIFLTLLFVILNLTGCGSDEVSGSYISETNSSRSLVFEKRSDAGVFDGLVTYSEGGTSSEYYYTVGQLATGPGVLLYDGNTEVKGFFVLRGNLHDPTNDEVFVKQNFFVTLWVDHKEIVIIVVAFLIIAGVVQTVKDKIEEAAGKTSKDDD